ncbi:RNA polymerase sigma factor SigF, partial [Asanoa sp. NPDC050611]
MTVQTAEKVDPAPALTDSATELLTALAAVPAGHPSRAALRDRTIEAWLPLANHLA